MSWTIHGLVASQLGDKATNMEIPGFDASIPVKNYIKIELNFDYDFLPVVAVVNIGWVLLFLFVFAYGIKFLNFQKR